MEIKLGVKISVVLGCIGIAILSACSRNGFENGNRRSDLQEKREWLKQYAYCQCLLAVYNNDSLLKQHISPGVYVNISDYPPDLYTVVDSLSKERGQSIQPSAIADYNGKKAVLLGCFNYYKSAQLDSLVRRYDHRAFIQK
jgi:hypothetical protein